jgi:hypothetical protein
MLTVNPFGATGVSSFCQPTTLLKFIEDFVACGGGSVSLFWAKLQKFKNSEKMVYKLTSFTPVSLQNAGQQNYRFGWEIRDLNQQCSVLTKFNISPQLTPTGEEQGKWIKSISNRCKNMKHLNRWYFNIVDINTTRKYSLWLLLTLQKKK